MFGATPLNIKLHNLSSIQAVQNLAASIVSNTRKYDHISPVFKEPLRLQLFYRRAIMAFKCKTGGAPYSKSYSITMGTTRDSQMLHTPLYKTATGQRTFYFRAVKL